MKRHRRAHLEPAGLAAVPAPDCKRQTQRAATARDEIGERQHGPTRAARAVGGQGVVMLKQASEGAEVDHGARVVGRRQAQNVSLQYVKFGKPSCFAALRSPVVASKSTSQA